MDEKARIKWNEIYSKERPSEAFAVQVLTENLHLLPESGRALDMACGLGANAMLLAERGLETHAWDCSEVALDRLQERANRQGLIINIEHRDVVTNPPEQNTFDIIVVSRFLERSIIRNIIDAIHPDGLVIYQTYTVNKLDTQGPTSMEYLLQENELLHLFRSLTVLFYREDGQTGNMLSGNRNEAMLVAQAAKPSWLK
jgi:2-polyprenyl-3-methyl-5-hydroxy-6-metoxy-1,4-benzoquinol methylase